MSKNAPRIILASQSKFRKTLLNKLKIKFTVASASIDETPLIGESTHQTVKRLARAKALGIKDRYPNALIIGSDELAELEGQPLGKPLTRAGALRQLLSLSGQQVIFYTSLCLLNVQTGKRQEKVIKSRVTFRELTRKQCLNYIEKDQPLHSAGSLKFESLGISLIRSYHSPDPNAIIGLPLITLIDFLYREGVSIP